MANNITRIKELIDILNSANHAYYVENESPLSDFEYDKLMDELINLEKKTGIVFANSPSKKVGGGLSVSLKKVKHTKPMLSAQKTKKLQDVYTFSGNRPVVISWKLDGLSIILKYKDGEFYQALTRGEDGLIGEDVTSNVSLIRNVPKKVSYKGEFEVRGEGVISYLDYKVVNRFKEQSHPRNVASGAIRAINQDIGKLSHIDFIAFELIDTNQLFKEKVEQLDFLTSNGFIVVDHHLIHHYDYDLLKEITETFDPKTYIYPVDGLIYEFNDIAFGKTMGATEHHERRMIALKWEDELYETTFRGVKMANSKNSLITLTALFDEVNIDGTLVKQADLHSLSNFEKLQLGVGDKIKVYKANMIVPQVEENETRSGTYILKDRCPICGAKLEVRVSPSGVRNLYCPNEACAGSNAIKISKFCDAMGIEGLSASVLEEIISYGFIKSYADVYRLKEHRDELFSISGLNAKSINKILDSIEEHRRVSLAQFLLAMNIHLMDYAAAETIDQYFFGSYSKFEDAIKNGFDFFHLARVSENLSKSIYEWYNNKDREIERLDVLKEISFKSQTQSIKTNSHVIAVTGEVNNMPREDIKEVLTLMGFANVKEDVEDDVTILLVGVNPDSGLISKAISKGIKIVPNSHFSDLCAENTIK